MSVNSEITRIKTAVSSAYDAVDDMGGTLPVSEVIASLANAIRTIPVGVDGDEMSYGSIVLAQVGTAVVGRSYAGGE